MVPAKISLSGAMFKALSRSGQKTPICVWLSDWGYHAVVMPGYTQPA